MNKIEKYLNQDIDNPEFLFHGSPYKLDKVSPRLSHDSLNQEENIAEAVFLFPSFIKSIPYAFKDTIKANSSNLDWSFDIPNDNVLPIMIMRNVNIDENIKGYIHVFKKDSDMIKDEGTYQYKCYKELIPCDVLEVCYKDFEEYFEIVEEVDERYVRKSVKFRSKL